MQTQIYRVTAIELLKGLRGKMTRSQLNARLGLASNQVHRWESGDRSLSWQSFCKITHLKKIDLRKILNRELGYSGPPENERDLFRHLIGQATVAEFSAVSKMSKSVITKIVAGTQRLKLEQILQVIDVQGLVLEEFLRRLCPNAEYSILEERIKKAALSELLYDSPILAAVGSALALQEYVALTAHVEGWLTKKLNLPEGVEEQLIQRALDVGLLRFSEGKLALVVERMDTRGSRQGNNRIRGYWLAVAKQKLTQFGLPGDSNRFAHVIASVSDEASAKLRTAMYEYFSAVRSILSDDTGPHTQVRVLLVQDIEITGRKPDAT